MTAPPEGGKANAAVRKLVADALGVPRGAVQVASGAASRHKRLEIDGATEADARAAFGEPPLPLL